jgi:integrase
MKREEGKVGKIEDRPELEKGLYWRKDSPFIWMRLPGGQCKSTETTCPKRAYVLLLDLKRKCIERRQRKGKLARTFEDVARGYDDEQRQNEVLKNTKGHWWIQYLKYARDTFGKIPFNEIVEDDFKSWLRADINHAKSDADGTPLSKEYRQSIFRLVRQVYKFGYEKGWHPGLRFPTIETVRGQMNKFGDKAGLTIRPWEVVSLMLAPEISMDRRILYGTAFFCGMRASETCGIQFEDVDFQRGLLTVVRQANGGPPKGGQQRTIIMHGYLRWLLKFWRDRGFEETHADSPENSSRIVQPTDGKNRTLPYRSAKIVRDTLHDDCAMIGLRTDLTPHLFRSALVTAGMEAGSDSDVIEQMTHPQRNPSRAHVRYRRPGIPSQRAELTKIKFPNLGWFPWFSGSCDHLNELIEWTRENRHKDEERGAYRDEQTPVGVVGAELTFDEQIPVEEERFLKVWNYWCRKFEPASCRAADEVTEDAGDKSIEREGSQAQAAGSGKSGDSVARVDNDEEENAWLESLEDEVDDSAAGDSVEGSEPVPDPDAEVVAPAELEEEAVASEQQWNGIDVVGGEKSAPQNTEAVNGNDLDRVGSDDEVQATDPEVEAEGELKAEVEAELAPNPVSVTTVPTTPTSGALAVVARIIGLPVEVIAMMTPDQIVEAMSSKKDGAAAGESTKAD